MVERRVQGNSGGVSWKNHVDDNVGPDACCLCTYGVSPAAAPDPCPFDSIQDAIDAANLDGGGLVVVRFGVYTENITMAPNVEVIAWSAEDDGNGRLANLRPQLVGTVTVNLVADGYTAWRGVDIQASGAQAVVFTGANYQNALFDECWIMGDEDGESVFNTVLLDNSGNDPTAGDSVCLFERCQIEGVSLGDIVSSPWAQLDAIGVCRRTIIRGPINEATNIQAAITLAGGTLQLQQCEIRGHTDVDAGATLVGEYTSFFTEAAGGAIDAAMDLGGTASLTYCTLRTADTAQDAIIGAGTLLHNSLTAFTRTQIVFANTVNGIPMVEAPPWFNREPLIHVGVLGSIAALGPSGAGTRFMYVPALGGALRHGSVTGTQWDSGSIGSGSFAHGVDTTASSAVAFSRGNQAVANRIGAMAWANGRFAADGDSQTVEFALRRTTADDTTTELTIDGAAPAGAAIGTSNRVILEDNTIYHFHIWVVMGSPATGGYAAYQAFGVAMRGVGAASVVTDGVLVTDVVESNPAFDFLVFADVVNGSVQFLVQGPAADDAFWSATLRMTQCPWAPQPA